MLRPHIKEYAESGNIRGLHYIFRDALDADPTFKDYQDSYVYCENVPGFFDPHKELTPFAQNPSQWNEAYWVQLKMDLMENFSKERYEHMRKVAQVFYAEKIDRFAKEEERRRQKKEELARENAKVIAGAQKQQEAIARAEEQKNQQAKQQGTVHPQQTAVKGYKYTESDEYRRKKEEMDRSNAEADASKGRVAQAKKELEEENKRAGQGNYQPSGSAGNGGSSSKKKMGVALAAVVLFLAIILLLRSDPSKATAAITAQKTLQELLAARLSGK